MSGLQPGEVLIPDAAGLSVDPGTYVLLALTDTGVYLCTTCEDDDGDQLATASRVCAHAITAARAQYRQMKSVHSFQLGSLRLDVLSAASAKELPKRHSWSDEEG